MVATRSIEECSASEISARLPIAMPTTNLAAAMPPLAKIEIAATEVLLGWDHGLLMGGGLAARHVNIKRRSTGAIATHLQERFVANCSEFNEPGYSVTTILPRCLLASMCSNALPMSAKL